MKIQKQLIENKFIHWKGKFEQIDDVLVVGIKFQNQIYNECLENEKNTQHAEISENREETKSEIEISAEKIVSHLSEEYYDSENDLICKNDNFEFNKIYNVIKQNIVYEIPNISELSHEFVEKDRKKIENIILGLGSQKFQKKALFVLLEFLEFAFYYKKRNSELNFLLSISDKNMYLMFKSQIFMR